MGINIAVVDAGGAEVSFEVWDWLRHAGDRRVPDNVAKDGFESLVTYGAGTMDEERAYRPKNIPRFLASMLREEPSNKPRWERLAGLFEQGYWVRYSY